MKLPRIKFIDNWDEDQKASAVRIIGLCVAALGVFLLISEISYLLHWKQDMGVAPGQEIKGAAGSLGYRTGWFLVGDCFGLGSFLLLLFPAALAARLIAGKWRRPLLRTLLESLAATFVCSLVLSYIGGLCGLRNAFAGGLGGRCGVTVTDWSISLVGSVVTAILLVIIVSLVLFFCSDRFKTWLSSFGKDRPEETAAPEEVVPEPAPEPIPVSEPEPEPEPEKPEKPEKPARPAKPAVPEPQAPEGEFTIETDDTLDKEVTKDLEPINNRLDPPDGLPRYKIPSLDLLEAHASARHEVTTEELTCNNNKIRAALANYKISVDDVRAIVGPTVTLYKVFPSAGVKISEIKKLQEDIAMSLKAKGVRVVTLEDSVGIEVANNISSIVPLKSLLNDDAFRNSKADLPVAIGYTITQKVKVFDLADAPHLLVAGATKQGKSVGLNVIVSSLLYSKHPSELKFVFIDPKMVEFSAYGQLLHHYLAVLPDAVSEEDEKLNAIVKKPKDAEKILRSLTTEMDERYELLAKAGVNNIKIYNDRYKSRKLNPNNGHKFLPYLVVVVDEYADLTMTTGVSGEARTASRSITGSIIRLAQKGRAAGIHVILATQRPSVDVISGIIKSNFPMRIAFRVASRVDSMTILDAPGAEKLIGKGDMLLTAGIENERIQCGYVSGEEIDTITEFIGDQQGYAKSYNTPYYLPIPVDDNAEGGGGSMTDMSEMDERFEEAAKLVVTTQKASTSYLQTRLGMGFAKAARVMGQLEAAGVVGPQEGAKPRQILVPDLNSLQPILDSFCK